MCTINGAEFAVTKIRLQQAIVMIESKRDTLCKKMSQ